MNGGPTGPALKAKNGAASVKRFGSTTDSRRERRFLLPRDSEAAQKPHRNRSEAAWCGPAAESAGLTHYWPVSFLGFGGA
jgi:hypothetical protein